MQNAVFDLRQNCKEDSSPEKLDNIMTKTAKKKRLERTSNLFAH